MWANSEPHCSQFAGHLCSLPSCPKRSRGGVVFGSLFRRVADGICRSSGGASGCSLFGARHVSSFGMARHRFMADSTSEHPRTESEQNGRFRDSKSGRGACCVERGAWSVERGGVPGVGAGTGRLGQLQALRSPAVLSHAYATSRCVFPPGQSRWRPSWAAK